VNQAGVERLYRIEYDGPGTVGADEVQLEDVQVVGQRRHTLKKTRTDVFYHQGSGTASQVTPRGRHPHSISISCRPLQAGV
jgi:hypothetical protein